MAGCGVPDTTPALKNNVAICPGGEKKKISRLLIHSIPWRLCLLTMHAGVRATSLSTRTVEALDLQYMKFANIKGIVSRDFGGQQMILMNSLCVPDVPLEVNCFF